jgi:anthranilate synthase/aminodeoxychorismate synthase-like glutamine amidotransferase
MEIRRNDEVTVEEIRKLGPERICVSPGPCSPNEAGVSCEVINEFGSEIPVLGVCLGHQAIGQVYGGEVVRADRLMHGKTSMIEHDGRGVFNGLEMPLEATRYHSLILQRSSLPSCLEVTAWCEDLIMGVRHKEHPVHGVQFHPESILTVGGKQLLANFLAM